MSDTEQHFLTDTVEKPTTQADEATASLQNGNTEQTPNGVDGDIDQHSERPNKRRRLTESLTPQQRPSPRAISPPWKKFSADGPTTFLDPHGKRRSGRTNALPLDLQPVSSKRRTRASLGQSGGSVTGRNSSTPNANKKAERDAASQSHSAPRPTRTASKVPQTSGSKSTRRYSLHSRREPPPSTPLRPHSRRKTSMSAKSPPLISPRSSQRQRRPSSRALEAEGWRSRGRILRNNEARSESELSEEMGSDSLLSSDMDDMELDAGPFDPNAKTPRLKFNITKPKLGTPSYGNTLQFARDTRTQWAKRQFTSLDEWMSWAVEHGHQIFPGYDVYEGDDEYLKDVIDDNETRKFHKELSRQSRLPVVPLTREQAKQEAETRQEVENALEPGGRLHPDVNTQLAPEKFDLGRRQYGHWDHFVAHGIRFRQLMNREHRLHQENARKLAYAAQDKWKAIQPKSQEEIEQEKEDSQHAILSATMRQCVRDLMAKWDLIRIELDKVRLARWQEEQDALGKKALNKVMEQSAFLLEARRKIDTSEMGSDTDDSNDIHGDSSDESGRTGTEDEDESDEEAPENMSSSGTDSDEDVIAEGQNGDEHLSIEELRKKYADPAVENHDRPADEEESRAGENGIEAQTPYARRAGSSADSVILADGLEAEDVPQLDENAQRIYNEVSDESDESVDMSEEESSDEEEDDSDDGSSSGSEGSGESDDNLGLFSLIATKTELKNAKADKYPEDTASSPEQEDASVALINDHDEEDEELEEVSLIPDAAQVQTPAASNDEAGVESYRLDPQPRKDRQSNLSIVTSSSPKPATPEPDTMEDVHIEDDDDDDKESGDKRESPINEPHDTPDQSFEEKQEAAIEVKDRLLQSSKEPSLPATPVSGKIIKTPVPSLLRATLREYQHFGLDWLAGLYAKDTNGILADEMGLGKTIQTISLLAHLAEVHGVWGPHLIVVPTSVMLNWEIEFKKFLPGFKVLVYYGTPEERKNKRKGWLDDDKWNVVITSYQLVLQDQASFKRRGWHYMVLDEAHNIKNWKSARWQTLLGFRTSHRLLLTGTPLQNNLTELWSLMFFLMPYSEDESGRPQFTGLEEFTSWFNKPVNQIMEQGRGELTEEARELVRRLHTILRPYILRRLKADVEKQMPAKYEHVVYCKLSKRQRHLYDGFMSRASTRETLASGNYLSIINCLMQLRKVCNHPDLFETRQIVTSYSMQKSAMADFEIKDLLLRRRMLRENESRMVNLEAINLVPAKSGPISALDTIQTKRVGAQLHFSELTRKHLEHVRRGRDFDGTSVDSSLAFVTEQAHQIAADQLDFQWKALKMRSQERPLMKQNTVDFIRRKLCEVKVHKQEFIMPVPEGDVSVLHSNRCRYTFPLKPAPASRTEYMKWLDYNTPAMLELTPSIATRAKAMQPYIRRFGCITPSVVAHGVDSLTCGQPGIQVIQELRTATTENSIAKIEPFHEAQTRLSIAFPDKRLLQYDCGKLQRLDILLRTLQAGGHRALIFTQMTKVLDILEQFLNIHGHRYLRLDGSTKIEQRQILTDRFNSDTRILAFILSSRSGGLGINLTGADTVIFYDLDWNPAMDKQCQDRCHRIGQTRDVHIYRFVSEYTIEANILRKANQKRLLDDVIIQDGDFTTEHFNNPNPHDTFEEDEMHEADAEANAAMDRVLGGGSSGENISTKLLAQAEDQEDRAAATVAEKEGHTDDADFNEKTSGTNTRADTPKTSGFSSAMQHAQADMDDMDENAEFFSGAVQPRTEAGMQIFAEKAGIGVDRYILEYLEWELMDVPIAPPEDKVKKKRGRKSEQYNTKRKR